jgi:hypothetical protein
MCVEEIFPGFQFPFSVRIDAERANRKGESAMTTKGEVEKPGKHGNRRADELRCHGGGRRKLSRRIYCATGNAARNHEKLRN